MVTITYTKVGWNETTTPVNPTNLDTMDTGIKTANDNIDAHTARIDNPHAVSASQIGAVSINGTASNADKLDGLHATAFIRRGGDTVTGTLVCDGGLVLPVGANRWAT